MGKSVWQGTPGVKAGVPRGQNRVAFSGGPGRQAPKGVLSGTVHTPWLCSESSVQVCLQLWASILERTSKFLS